MKRFIYALLSLLCAIACVSCSNDEWGNDNEEMANVYYIGFEDWGKFKNDVTFNVVHGATIAIPMQFYCEYIRSYDVETYYYMNSSLTRGIDYEVVDSVGNSLQPNANGAFILTWPQAKKGVQNVYIKALNGKTGSLNVKHSIRMLP